MNVTFYDNLLMKHRLIEYINEFYFTKIYTEQRCKTPLNVMKMASQGFTM